MYYSLFGFALLLLFAIAVLSIPRLQHCTWTVLARIGQVAVLVLLGTCGTFSLQPSAAPQWLVHSADPILKGTMGMPLDAGSGVPWLVVAVLAVGFSLPVLMLVELGLNLSAQAAQVQALRDELRQAAADNRGTAIDAPGPLDQRGTASTEMWPTYPESDLPAPMPKPVPSPADLAAAEASELEFWFNAAQEEIESEAAKDPARFRQLQEQK